MKISDVTSHVSCVYCLEFPNGMKYVGKTKDLVGRMGLYLKFSRNNKYLSDAFSEFGVDNVDVSVLREVKCNDDVDLELCLSILEIKYIRELGTVYPNGYNVSLGGEVLGIPVEYITTDSDYVKAYGSGDKSVLVYDLDGKLVGEYPSIARLAYDKGISEDVVRNCLNKSSLALCGKWYVRVKRYDYAPNEIEVNVRSVVKKRIIYEDVVKERVKYNNVFVDNIVERDRVVVRKDKVLRYDMNGDFRGEYDCLKDACRAFTGSSSGMSYGVYRKGYILFKKRDDNYPTKIEPYTVLSKKVLGDYYVPASELPDKDCIKEPKNKVVGRPKCERVVKCESSRTPLRVNGKYTNLNNTFKVAQYDLGGNLIKVFDNMRDASAETGIAYSGIWACVMGRAAKSKGFKWAKYEE